MAFMIPESNNFANYHENVWLSVHIVKCTGKLLTSSCTGKYSMFYNAWLCGLCLEQHPDLSIQTSPEWERLCSSSRERGSFGNIKIYVFKKNNSKKNIEHIENLEDFLEKKVLSIQILSTFGGGGHPVSANTWREGPAFATENQKASTSNDVFWMVTKLQFDNSSSYCKLKSIFNAGHHFYGKWWTQDLWK